MIREELILKVKNAFKNVKLNNGISWKEARVIDSHGNQEERKLARLSDEKDNWENISISLITDSTYQDNLAFLDIEGFLFYLPICIISSIKEYSIFEKGSKPSQTLIYDSLLLYLTNKEKVDELQKYLNSIQIECVSDYLQFCLHTKVEFFDTHMLVEKINKYWLYKRFNTIETERLTLRLTNLEDAEFIYELLNMPKWIQYIGDRNVHSIKDAENYIKERMLPQVERLGYGNYTVIRKSDNVKVGCCGLYDRDGLEGVDIGFSFLPKYEGYGYASEASFDLKEKAFTEFGVTKILAITTKENYSLQKLIKKLGLEFIKMTTIPNDNEELMLFEILKK